MTTDMYKTLAWCLFHCILLFKVLSHNYNSVSSSFKYPYLYMN